MALEPQFWVVFDTQQDVAGMPELNVLGKEIQYNTSYRFRGADRQQNVHCIFQYTLEGYGLFEDVNGIHTVRAGQAFLCESHDATTAYGYPAEASKPWQFIFLAFKGGISHQMTRRIVSAKGHIHAIPSSHLIIRKLLSYQVHDGVLVGVSTVEASKLIFSLFEALMEENETVPGQTDNPTLRQAVYKINSRLDEPLTVTLLADELRVSRRHLTHLFQSEMGISPYQFIMQQKNLLACRLLKSTTLSVSEIALRVGYATPTHFSRAFQRMLRMPPREFRRNGTIPCW